MNTNIAEIEAAIENLPVRQVEELANWFHAFRLRLAAATPLDRWLARARGAALPGVTTEQIMALTRDEE